MTKPATSILKPIVLSGFMATGKTTLGRHLAVMLGVPFVDTDAEIETETGSTIAEIFAREGEARFREIEASVAMRTLADPTPRVISFGGGTITSRAVRFAALDAATVVTLEASAGAIVERAETARRDADGADRANLTDSGLGSAHVRHHAVDGPAASTPVPVRPLLAKGASRERVEALLELRADAYAEAHGVVRTDDNRSIAEHCDSIVACAARDVVVMPLGQRTYSIEICDNNPERLVSLLAELKASMAIVVTDSNVVRAREAWLSRAFAGAAMPHHRIVMHAGEVHKNLATVTQVWDEALACAPDRNAVIVAVGGGVVGDVAGFAASTLLRGVRLVQVPTSLLAMVDSSVGGKTGFDHARGKNLLGSFYQPNAVLIDGGHLTTLASRELVAGLAEIVKVALVADGALFATLEEHAEHIRTGSFEALRGVIRAAVTAKAQIVRSDERERGARALLNLGHTIGHALEAHGHFETLLHGEAVAIGTVIELRAAEAVGHSERGLANRASELLTRLGLPTNVSRETLEASWPFIAADKKRAGRTLNLPIATEVGHGAVVNLTLDALRQAVLTG